MPYDNTSEFVSVHTLDQATAAAALAAEQRKHALAVRIERDGEFYDVVVTHAGPDGTRLDQATGLPLGAAAA